VDGADNVYVAYTSSTTFSEDSASVYRVTPDGVETVIFGTFGQVGGIAVDDAGNVYVASKCSGFGCSNGRAFRITPDGETTEILDTLGDGVNGCGLTRGIAADASRTAYVTSTTTSNAFRVAPCPADIDGSGTVDVVDLLQVLSHWGPCENDPECEAADIDGDGDVTVLDLLQVLSAWGPCL
jgi:sugar lactone lactonase YvrE